MPAYTAMTSKKIAAPMTSPSAAESGQWRSPSCDNVRMKPTPLHPRNRHRGHYDFPALVRASPALAKFVRDNGHGEASIDFTRSRTWLRLS